jgi:hypothetical protein
LGEILSFWVFATDFSLYPYAKKVLETYRGRDEGEDYRVGERKECPSRAFRTASTISVSADILKTYPNAPVDSASWTMAGF